MLVIELFDEEAESLKTRLQTHQAWLNQVSNENRKVLLHVHCHQKALPTPMDFQKALELTPGVTGEMVPTGCCGMSGEFGYKHYDVSKKIAEQVLLPRLALAEESALIVATGTSCRHQIEGLGHQSALHIAQVFDRLLN